MYDETMETTRGINKNITEATRDINRDNMEATREKNETIEVTREMNETIEATREFNRENMDSTREMDAPMEIGENLMTGGDGENGIAVGEDQNDMTGGENDVGWKNLFQLVNESLLKSYFNNGQDLCERFTQFPKTIRITRSLNPRIVVVVVDE
ncbi:UNVERIFIED_CONTAM: hypothetical protein NCL1_45252 [Trichonephila clavipes]